MPVTSAKQHSLATPVTLSQRVIIAVGASLLGLCLVYFAGFSHIELCTTPPTTPATAPPSPATEYA